ncbi:MAG: hypothetical protein EOP13_27610 [Pseudomonas sp.]|uniref:hypothetical protein n=1 Tax=Pseudomonas sp. TaxID=306 RepID=UPI0011FDA64C|nr:hypothetical protein [Pseudomonas sp.]RZI67940.1 MAG: hypothetical protein EOP13_27610 [Pseudomonas sp.]
MTNPNMAEHGHDASELRTEPPTPSQSGSGGGTLATDIGSEDEEKTARGGDPQPTRATKEDKVQPRNSARSDHSGAAR